MRDRIYRLAILAYLEMQLGFLNIAAVASQTDNFSCNDLLSARHVELVGMAISGHPAGSVLDQDVWGLK